MEVVAHRGASAYAPEHTAQAYDLALGMGADWLELDVRASRDGSLVVLHDPTLARTHGDPRVLAAVDVSDLPEPRPLLLAEILAAYGRRARLLVELKDPTPLMEDELLALLDAHLAPDVVVQSFDGRSLRRLARRRSDLRVARLVHPWSRPMAAIAAAAGYAHGVGIHHRLLQPAHVAAAHARGLAVRAWTVNDRRDMDRLLALGVDGLITDVPDVARAAIAGAAMPAAA